MYDLPFILKVKYRTMADRTIEKEKKGEEKVEKSITIRKHIMVMGWKRLYQIQNWEKYNVIEKQWEEGN